jgi:hypothetical protein
MRASSTSPQEEFMSIYARFIGVTSLILAITGCTLTHTYKECPDGTVEHTTTVTVDGEVIGQIISAVVLPNGLVRITIQKEDGSTVTRDVDKGKYEKAKSELEDCVEEKREECDEARKQPTEPSLVSAYDIDEYSDVGLSAEVEPGVEEECCEFTCEVTLDLNASVSSAARGSQVVLTR